MTPEITLKRQTLFQLLPIGKPLSKSEAYLFLCFISKNGTVNATVKELESIFYWKRGRVRSFLKTLQNYDLIKYTSTQKNAMITVCGTDNCKGVQPTENQQKQGELFPLEPVVKRQRSKKSIPESVDDVRAYCEERKNGIDPQEFWDNNQAKGWVTGKNLSPIKDWKAVVRTWEHNRKKNGGGNSGKIKSEV